jgi:hypothetical protein
MMEGNLDSWQWLELIHGPTIHIDSSSNSKTCAAHHACNVPQHIKNTDLVCSA